MAWSTLIFWTAICLVLEAFFSGSELALVSADKLKLAHRAGRGDQGARMALALANKPDWFFSATLLGQNLFIIANSLLVTFFIITRYGENFELLGLLLSPIVLIFGEAVPKSLFQQSADTLAPKVAPVVTVFSYLFFPIVWPLSKLTLLLMGGVRGSLLQGHEVTRESLELLFGQSEAPRQLSPVFKKSLVKILTLFHKKVFEIMTPLVEVFSLRDTTTIEEAIPLCGEEGYSFVPIFHKRAYNIVGVVGVFDLLLTKNLKAPVTSLMEAPLHVSNLMGARNLFLLMKEQQKNFAVVVDEFGGAVGIVTLEDILEEMVGEIEDEYDVEKVSWEKMSTSQYLFDGRISISEINEKLHWDLPHGRYETLGGFLVAQLGHMPQSGEVLQFGNLTFLIKKATARSVDKILVEVG